MTGLTAERDTAGAARRSDAGTVKITQRDITGLMLCAEHGGAPYGLLATALAVQPARLRGIVARWRAAGTPIPARSEPGRPGAGSPRPA